MVLLVVLLVAVLLFAVLRVLAGRRMGIRRHGIADTEKGVVMATGTSDGERKFMKQTPPPHDIKPLPAKLPRRCDDSQAANDQLLSEFAASTALDRSDTSTLPSLVDAASNEKPSPVSSEEQPILVNPKQFHRILKRRAARQAMEESLRLMAQRMERGRELRSMRGFDGVVAGAVR